MTMIYSISPRKLPKRLVVVLRQKLSDQLHSHNTPQGPTVVMLICSQHFQGLRVFGTIQRYNSMVMAE